MAVVYFIRAFYSSSLWGVILRKSEGDKTGTISSLFPVDSEQFVNIAFASDQAYLPYTSVTLASVLRNYSGKKALRVFLLTDKTMPAADVGRFEELRKIRDFEFHSIIVDASKFGGLQTSEGISIATYYRLLMHRLLPSDCTRVVYLDSDILVLDSIEKILSDAPADKIFCGVEDTISSTYLAKSGLPPTAKHVNAGVLVANINIMRSIDFDDRISAYIAKNKYRITLGDQQILAEVFPFDIHYLPLRWNVHGGMFQEQWVDEYCGRTNSMDREEAALAIASPSIVHFTLKRKPWLSPEHPKTGLWFEYLRLSPYRDSVLDDPSEEPPPLTSETKAAGNKKPTLQRFVRTVLPATWKSFRNIRKTRIEVDRHGKRLSEIERKLAESAALPPETQRDRLDVVNENAIRLKQLLTAMAKNRPEIFDAASAIQNVPADSMILSNVTRANIHGGYAEYVKGIFRTNNIRYDELAAPKAVLLLSQRLDQGMFWKCIETAYLRDMPLFFIEVGLFAGFAGFFDKDASFEERKALGFLIDDMGYYFDARQPSRLERTLNDPSFSLTNEQQSRARALIERICTDNITKYNRYFQKSPPPISIEGGCVLVVDQKRGDASIEFAGANDQTFRDMLQAAVAENPGRQIYFKRHPDSIQRNMNSYRNRNIKEIKVLPDDISVDAVIPKCHSVYTVSSQVGFEALLRGKKVVTFGTPFFAGWGLTDDRNFTPRRSQPRTIEDIFHQICIVQTIYFDPETSEITTPEATFDRIMRMRAAVTETSH